jgi:hypothetical protein
MPSPIPVDNRQNTALSGRNAPKEWTFKTVQSHTACCKTPAKFSFITYNSIHTSTQIHMKHHPHTELQSPVCHPFKTARSPSDIPVKHPWAPLVFLLKTPRGPHIRSKPPRAPSDVPLQKLLIVAQLFSTHSVPLRDFPPKTEVT